MPNTLAHIGIQALITRGLIRQADMGWILTGCLLPDLPWILQRIVRALPLEVSPYDLRLYAVVQSSLAVCLIGAGALACLSARPLRAWSVLGLGCLLHLLLDATQTKWANGVVLFAPLDWRVLNFGLYWPEDWPTLAMTAFGLGYFTWAFATVRPWIRRQAPPRIPPARWGMAAALAGLYLLLPVPLMPGALDADPHYVATLQAGKTLAGRPVGFDRSRLVRDAAGRPLLMPWTNQTVLLRGGNVPQTDGTVSVLGRFGPDGALRVDRLHAHPPGRRDGFSYAGLLAVALWGTAALWARIGGRKTRPKAP